MIMSCYKYQARCDYDLLQISCPTTYQKQCSCGKIKRMEWAVNHIYSIPLIRNCCVYAYVLSILQTICIMQIHIKFRKQLIFSTVGMGRGDVIKHVTDSVNPLETCLKVKSKAKIIIYIRLPCRKCKINQSLGCFGRYLILAYFGDFKRFTKLKIGSLNTSMRKYIVQINQNEFIKVTSTEINETCLDPKLPNVRPVKISGYMTRYILTFQSQKDVL